MKIITQERVGCPSQAYLFIYISLLNKEGVTQTPACDLDNCMRAGVCDPVTVLCEGWKPFYVYSSTFTRIRCGHTHNDKNKRQKFVLTLESFHRSNAVKYVNIMIKNIAPFA